jgi:type II secretory pathway pseudopilin PulG
MVFKFFPNIKNSEKGITLVELVVVTCVIAIFTVIAVSNFPEIQRQYALSRVTYKLAQDFRSTEDWGLSGVLLKNDSGELITKVKGYGIYIDKSGSDKQYLLYADIGTVSFPNGNAYYDNPVTPVLCSGYNTGLGGDTGDCILGFGPIDISNENVNLKINSVLATTDGTSYVPNNNPLSINFQPPNPDVIINNSGANSFVGVKIVLELSNSGTTKTVLVNKYGLINVQ